MKIRLKTLLALLTCILFTAACGQKGPLYLPGQSSTMESMLPEQQPAMPEASEDDEEDRNNSIN